MSTFFSGGNVEVMTYFEQACQRRAIALWHQRPDFHDWHARIIVKMLRYSDVSRPTSSSSLLLLSAAAAAGADVYRSQAPHLSLWTRSLASEPQLLSRMIGDLVAKIQREIGLHQEIAARITRWAPHRIR